MANDPSEYMKDVLAAPLGELISSIGAGVAEAQTALDAASLAQTLQIYSQNDEAMIRMLRDVGYQPTFYALQETEVEAQVSMAIAVAGTTDTGAPKTRMYATPVNAVSGNRYNMSAAASAKLRFKIVPVPPSGEMAEVRVVPDLTGKTPEEVDELLKSFGLRYSTAEESPSGKVGTQLPAPGTIVRSGSTIALTFG